MKEYSPVKIAKTAQILSTDVSLSKLPQGFVIREKIGLMTTEALDGIVLHRSEKKPDCLLFEVRGTITPKGDYLVMFPDGGHYNSSFEKVKVNEMTAYRSKDRGRTWEGPVIAFDIDFDQHGFIPLIPKGSNRIYSFGTQPVRNEYSKENGQGENAPIGYFYSDDDGYNWTGPIFIRPKNDPGFKGMSVTRMCETDAGTWLIGAHEADWQCKPLKTWQYILRSENQGKSWQVLPDKRRNGLNVPGFDRMDEGRLINLGNDKAMIMIRTPEGHIWAAWSNDDGKTWTKPEPTTLVHPDAPPMVFHLSDVKTLACFHHNRHHDLDYTGLFAEKEEIMKDRSEMWVSFSYDEGHNWSEPRFLFVNSAEPDFDSPFRNYQCSYMDMFVDGDTINLLVPHRWNQVLYLTIKEKELLNLPLRSEVKKMFGI